MTARKNGTSHEGVHHRTCSSSFFFGLLWTPSRGPKGNVGVQRSTGSSVRPFERGLSVESIARAYREQGVDTGSQPRPDSGRQREKQPQQRELFEPSAARRPPRVPDCSAGDS